MQLSGCPCLVWGSWGSLDSRVPDIVPAPWLANRRRPTVAQRHVATQTFNLSTSIISTRALTTHKHLHCPTWASSTTPRTRNPTPPRLHPCPSPQPQRNPSKKSPIQAKSSSTFPKPLPLPPQPMNRPRSAHERATAARDAFQGSTLFCRRQRMRISLSLRARGRSLALT